MPIVKVTRKHIFRGDADEPERHPVALAFKEVFPEYTPEVYYEDDGWYAVVGGFGWWLHRDISDLCWDLSNNDIGSHLARIWYPNDKTYKFWVWELYKDRDLGLETTPLGDPRYTPYGQWLELCYACMELHYQCDMEDKETGTICRFCVEREPELAS